MSSVSERQIHRFTPVNQPSRAHAEGITNVIKGAWIPDGEDEPVYAHPERLDPASWIGDGHMAQEIANGRIYPAIQTAGEQVKATSSLLVHGGHIEIGSVAASEPGNGYGVDVVAENLRTIRDLDLPGAIVDIAAVRTGMTTILDKATRKEGFDRLRMYVSPAVYGDADHAWGCFGEYAVPHEYLEQHGKFVVSVPDSLPASARKVVMGIVEINNEQMMLGESNTEEQTSLLPTDTIVEGHIVAVDMRNTQDMQALASEGYVPMGLLPFVRDGQVHWRLQYGKGELSEVVGDVQTHLRRGVSRMYSVDDKQREVAFVVNQANGLN
ncbi:MAG TPA: hypothetical protein VFQ63_03415 [Patescibacteria group bacterium]|nr:hypothetical protein [Patescibacteria group bacterium]